jgi:hypothetical protein
LVSATTVSMGITTQHGVCAQIARPLTVCQRTPASSHRSVRRLCVQQHTRTTRRRARGLRLPPSSLRVRRQVAAEQLASWGPVSTSCVRAQAGARECEHDYAAAPRAPRLRKRAPRVPQWSARGRRAPTLLIASDRGI